MPTGKQIPHRPARPHAFPAGRVEPLESRRLLAASPVPLTPEFAVSTTSALDQSRPAVAADGTGRFVAAWDSQGQSGRGVIARVFGADGSPVGGEFVVNLSISGDRFRPAVAASPVGFVVAWVSKDGEGSDVYAQCYDAGGNARGAEFRVHVAEPGIQNDPAVAMAPDGRFVVTWVDDSINGDGSRGINARLFGANGLPRGGSFKASTIVEISQMGPAAGMAPDGSFVLCWQSDQGPGSNRVDARRFAADGTARGDEFAVTTDTSPQVREPAIAADAGGGFTVAWQTEAGDGGTAGDGSGSGVFARRYDADGAPRGDAFPVNVQTAGDQGTPSVSAGADDSFVVAWHSAGHDGDGLGVYARRFDGGGAASDEVAVNTYTAGDQWAATAAVGVGGRFLITWRSAAQDGSGDGVYARVFGPEAPVDMPVASVSDAAATETDEGAATEAVFTVTLSGARTYPVTVRYATRDATAIARVDFDPISGAVTFAPGETSKTVSVTVGGDALDEPDETFFLDLSEPVDATLGAASATGHIVDNDPLPFMTISDAQVGEGNDGDRFEAAFAVNLSGPSGRTINVGYRLGIGAADTATRGEDFDATPNIVTFAPGETHKTILVPIIGDSLYEGTETFSVVLAYVETPTFNFPDDGEAVGTISEDDTPPSLIEPVVEITEDDDPAGRLIDVPLTLSKAAAVPVTVRYATADEGATAPGDYEASSGTVTFAPGETSKVIQVRVFGDDVEEVAESFLVRFSDPQNVIAGHEGEVVIRDDDVQRAVVTGVFVDSSAWTPAFRQHLAETGAGVGEFGVLVGDGLAQLDELPWTNLDRLSIRFNRDVTAQQFNLTVRGASGAEYPLTLIQRDGDAFVYTWTFAVPFPKERLTLTLNGSHPDGVRDAFSGESLDGEWANGADAYPSGDGTAGGDFVFNLNVLPGDVTRDGRVDATDLADVRARQTTRVSRPGTGAQSYSIVHDVNGSGSIDVLDYAHVRARQQTTLPPLPQPAAVTAVASPSRPRGTPARRDLFGDVSILG